MPSQIANSFDPKTKKKIFVGFLLALSGGISVFLIAMFMGIDAAKAVVAGVVSTAMPTVVNAVKEYMVGDIVQ